MSYRLRRHATWRDDFKDFKETVADNKNAKQHVREVKQQCRDAVARGDLAKLDEIQSKESNLDQFIDACRKEITE